MLGALRGCSSMAEFQPSKLAMRVRFPSPALSLFQNDGASAVGSAPAPVAQPGQSKGLLIPRPQVRILPGAPPFAPAQGLWHIREPALDSDGLRADDSRDEEVPLLRGRDPRRGGRVSLLRARPHAGSSGDHGGPPRAGDAGTPDGRAAPA